jgi:hypothetical protein
MASATDLPSLHMSFATDVGKIMNDRFLHVQSGAGILASAILLVILAPRIARGSEAGVSTTCMTKWDVVAPANTEIAKSMISLCNECTHRPRVHGLVFYGLIQVHQRPKG